MSVSPRCLVQSAADLLDNPAAAEPQFRAIVSRAYYGAFHSANIFARQTLGIDLDNLIGGKHLVLSSSLASYKCSCKDTEREIKRAGARLQIFHILRIRADYLINETITEKEASAQVRNSFELIDHLEEITQKLAA